ncbi:MAG: hypothetical protein A3F16_06395 [Deltaproteobacteria bacterium RIFCSPHIGHO2_12_FULL_43_9]|nr:MAG: hypothetical protein A3F16_06395 [Deltaproteobacteria bacterium RIFCSPHIGHO2_12_FULL_43_9]
MKRLFLFLILLCGITVLGLPLSEARAQTPDTICGVNVSEFPPAGKDITRYTCIVDGDSVFDKWVYGLAFAWVNAPSGRVFEVLTDYKNCRRNICNVERVRVVTERENYRVVEWKVLNDSGSTRYTNEYFLYPDAEPKGVIFNYIGPGEVDDMEGEWSVFADRSFSGRTLLRYIVKLNPETVFTDAAKDFVHRNLECLLSGLRNWAEQDSSLVAEQDFSLVIPSVARDLEIAEPVLNVEKDLLRASSQ